MLTIKKVLVATDFSDCSDTALMYGRALAQQFGAEVHVLHAVEAIGAVDVMAMSSLLTAVPDLEGVINESRARLDRLVSDADRSAGKETTALRTRETPAQAIVNYAAEHDVDLIVIGTHGRRGFSHLMLGSVAEKVVRTATRPVLTVRHPEREFVVIDQSPA